MNIRQEWKEIVCNTAVTSYKEHLVAGTSGNVSFMDRQENLIYITPGSLSYISMTPDDIVVIDINGTVIEGRRKPSSEWRLHAELYRAMAHVDSVIHTHSPYATGFAVAGKRIPLILVEMLPFLGGDIPVAEFGMPGSCEVGENAAAVMKNRNGALLKNHGVVAVGKHPEQAYLRAVYIEDAAKICALASMCGTPQVLEQNIERKLREKYGLGSC